MTATGAVLVGITLHDLLSPDRWQGTHFAAWPQLAICLLFAFSGVMQFQLGLRGAQFPPDNKSVTPSVPTMPKAPAR